MSNSKWRKPAPGMDAVKDEYQQQAKETLSQLQARLKQTTGIPEIDRGMAAVAMAMGDVPPTATSAADGGGQTPPSPQPVSGIPTAMGEDTHATETEPVQFGGSTGYCPDMRVSPGMLRGPERTTGVMKEFEVLQMLGDVQRFLWKMIRVAGEIVDTVPIGELRRVVAEDLAMPGDVVNMDGSTTKGVTPGATTEHRKGPRGSSHPLMKLLGFALQAAKLLRQYNSGTHPQQHNKAMRREMLDSIARAEKWAKDLMAGRRKEEAAAAG